MKVEIIRAPGPGFINMLAEHLRPQAREAALGKKWGAIGLVQGKLIDLYWASDAAEKASTVTTALVSGNCPQHIQMLAIFGQQSEVQTAVDKISKKMSDR